MFVLKSLASKVLNAVLVDYVEGFQDNIQSFSVYGELELKDLVIKKSVLDKFYLPIELKQGIIKKMFLNVPWTDLSGKPSIVTIENLYFLIGPTDINKFDEKEEQRINQLKKMEKLEMAEAIKKSIGGQMKDMNSDTFSSQIVTKFISNLQITIKNLHVRYEDCKTGSKPFSCGFTIDELYGQTTDQNGNICHMEPSKIMFKTVLLKNLSMYWDSHSTSLQYSNIEEFSSLMFQGIFNATQSPSHSFVVPPITCNLRLQLNHDKAPNMNIPKITAQLKLPSVSLSLEQHQYKEMILLSDHFSAWKKGWKNRSLRPTSSPSEKPLAWWLYTINTISRKLADKNKQWSWSTIAQRRANRTSYVNYYKKYLASMVTQSNYLTSEENTEMEDLHSKLSFEDILYFRTIAELQWKQEKGSLLVVKEKPASSGWFSGFWGSKSQPEYSLSLPTNQTGFAYLEQIQLTEEDWKELYSAIDYDDESALKPPPEWIKYSFLVQLNTGSITLSNRELKKEIGALIFDNLQVELSVRPQWKTLNASLSRLKLTDSITENSNFPNIISPISMQEDSLFSLVVQAKPINSPVDLDIAGTMKPLNVFYNKNFVDTLIRFFKVDNGYKYPVEESVVDQVDLRYRYLIEKPPTFSLKLDLHAPNLIFVEDICDKTSTTMAVVLGRFIVQSIENNNLKEEPYDRLYLQMKSLQLILTSAENISTFLQNTDTENPLHLEVDSSVHFVEPFNLNFNLEICRITSKSLPKIKINGDLPSLKFNISPTPFQNFLKMMTRVTDQLLTTNETQGQLVQQPDSTFANDLIAISLDQSKNDLEEPYQKAVADFSLPDATIHLYADSCGLEPQKPVAKVSFQGFHANGVVTQNESNLQANLRRFCITDLLNKGSRYIASSFTESNDKKEEGDIVGSEDIVYVKYTSTPRNSPTYKGINQEYTINFNNLLVNYYDRNYFTRCINLYLEMITVYSQGNEEKIQEQEKNTVDTQKEQGKNEEKIQEQEKNTQKEQSEVERRVSISLKSLKFDLCDEDDPFSIAQLTDSAIVMDKIGPNLLMKGHLGNLLLTDSGGLSRHNHVFHLPPGEKMITFTFNMVPYGGPLEQFKVKEERVLDMTLHSMKFLYINQFVDKIFLYQRLFVSALAVNEIRKDKPTDSVTLNRYKIKCKEPTIIIPQLQVEPNTSEAVIIANLGRIDIENKFWIEKEELFETVYVSTEGGLVSSAFLPVEVDWRCNEFVDVHSLVKNCAFQYQRQVPSFPANLDKDSTPDLCIQTKIAPIHVHVTQRCCYQLINIWRNNFEYVPNEKQLKMQNAEKPKPVPHDKTVYSSQTEIPEISISLSEDNLSPIFNFMAKNLSYQSDTKSTGTLQRDIKFSSLVFNDERSVNVAASMRRFIEPCDEMKNSFELTQTVSPNGTQYISGTIAKFKVIAIPGLIFKLHDILTPVFNKYTEGSKDTPKLDPQQTTDTSTKYSFTITEQLFIIPEDVSNEDSRVISLSANGVLSYTTTNSITSTMTLENIQISRANSMRETPLFVLEPFKAILKYDENNSESLVTCLFPESLKFNISYEDIKMMVGISYQYFQKSSFVLLSRKPGQTPPKPRNKMEISFKKMEMILIDDVRGMDMPFFNLKLSEFFLTKIDSNQAKVLNTKAHLYTNMMIDFYNTNLEVWEPFVEDCFFKMEMDGHKYNISTKNLYINITKPFMVLSKSTIQRWLSDWEAEPPKIAVSSRPPVLNNPLHIRNWTGTTLYYQLPGQQVEEIKDKESVKIQLPKKKVERSEARARKVDLSLAIEKGRPYTNSVSIDIGKHLMWSDTSLLVCDVSYFMGNKMITLMSRLLIKNNTNIPFQIKVSNNKNVISVDPDQITAVPVASSFASKLSFRPLIKECNFSEHFETTKMTPHTKIITLGTQSETSFSFSQNLDFAYDQLNRPCKSQFLLSFAPWLILENCLPTKLRFNLKMRNKVFVAGEIGAGEIEHIYKISNIPGIQMSLQIPGFKSTAAQISPTLDDEIPLINSEGKEICLKLQKSQIGNTMVVSIYSPYWLINSTGLDMQYYHDNTEYDIAPNHYLQLSSDLQESLPFRGQHCLYSDASQLLYVRIGNSSFSQSLSLSTIKNSGFLEVKMGSRKGVYQLAVQIAPGPGKFWRSKVITFWPRYTIKNNTKNILLCKQEEDNQQISISPGDSYPFHWFNSECPRLIRIKPSSQEFWSGPFSFQRSKVAVRMKNSMKTEQISYNRSYRCYAPSNDSDYFIKSLIHIQADGRTEINFSDDTQSSFYKIHNSLLKVIYVRQKVQEDYKGTETFYEVFPETELDWAWDMPQNSHTLEVLIDDQITEVEFDIIQINSERKEVEFLNSEGKRKIAIVYVSMVDHTFVLKVEEYGEKREPVLDQEDWSVELNLNEIGISLVDDTPKEILFISLQECSLNFIQYITWKKRHLKLLIQEFQIDNQLPSAPYPVLLHTRIRDHPQFFKGSLLFSEEQRNLYHLHYLSFLMNQLEISIDEHLAIQLMRFIDLTMESLEKEEESKKIKEPSKEATDLPDQQMLYATLVHFNPIRIRLSFRGNRKGEQNEENSKKFDTASKLLSLPKTLIPNVDRAPIIFKALLVQGALTSTSDIAERLSRHYLNQLNSQIYSLLGSAQVLGSPISFVADLSDGVADFFYEPAKGMTLSPEEFLKGIGKGSFSLVRNSIFSLFGSASKITGSLGTGVALLSFDDKYQERRLQQKHTQASNVVDGFATGVEELGKGIFGGLFGIVADPVKGAIKSGPVGLVTGLAKGVVNVVVKPTVGVMDFASRVTEGIQNTPDEFLEKAKPKRKPRYFPTDNRLECFDHEKAYGKYIVSLHSETDIYIDHIHIHQPIVGYCFVLDSSILITYPDYSAKTILTFPGLESVTLKKVNDKHFAIYFIKKETFMITANKLEAEKIYPIIKNAWNQWKERPDLE